MISDVLKETKEGMDKTIQALHRELATIRAGRASTTVLDSVMVDYYGTPTPLKQLGQVNAPEATMIVVQPYDVSAIPEIEKAITKSNLGLNPANDGRIVRIPMPPLTEERRKELVKSVKALAEESRIAIRNQRRDANDTLKDLEKEKEISEDESKSAQDEVQKLTDKHVEKIGEMIKEKEQSIMHI